MMHDGGCLDHVHVHGINVGEELTVREDMIQRDMMSSGRRMTRRVMVFRCVMARRGEAVRHWHCAPHTAIVPLARAAASSERAPWSFSLSRRGEGEGWTHDGHERCRVNGRHGT